MLSSWIEHTISVSGDAIHPLQDGKDTLNLYCMSGKKALAQTYSYQLNLSTALNVPDKLAANLALLAMRGRELTVTTILTIPKESTLVCASRMILILSGQQQSLQYIIHPPKLNPYQELAVYKWSGQFQASSD